MTDATPPAAGLRRTVELRSAPVLLWFASRPRFLLPGLVVVLLVAGLAAPLAYGLPLLGVLLLLLVWLSYLSWPALDAHPRRLRVAVVAMVVLAAVQRVLA